MQRLQFVSMLAGITALTTTAVLAADSTVDIGEGSGNVVGIVQAGADTETSNVTIGALSDRNTVNVGQSAGGAGSITTSGVNLGTSSDDNEVNVRQSTSVDNTRLLSTVFTTQARNAVINVSQTDPTFDTVFSEVNINGSSGDTVDVVQNLVSFASSVVTIEGLGGGGNKVGVLQDNATQLVSAVDIVGSTNSVAIFQDGGGGEKNSQVMINGDENTATVIQTGSVAVTSSIDIGSLGNIVNVTQAGTDLQSDVGIDGDNNLVDVVQNQSDHISGVSITGNANMVGVGQTGFQNTSGVVIEGNDNAVKVAQEGRFNNSLVALTSSSNTNTVAVDQSLALDFNVSDIAMMQSSGNSVTHIQRGSTDFAFTSLSFAAGNTVTVTQN